MGWMMRITMCTMLNELSHARHVIENIHQESALSKRTKYRASYQLSNSENSFNAVPTRIISILSRYGVRCPSVIEFASHIASLPKFDLPL